MANAIVNRQVNIYISSGEAQKALDKLIAKEKVLKDELAKATDPKRITQLKNELTKLAEPIDRATKKLKGELTPSLRDVQRTVNTLGARLKKMSTQDADFSSVLNQYRQAQLELSKIKAQTDQLNKSQASLKKQSFIGSFLGNLAAGAITAITSKISAAAQQSVQWALQTEGVKRAFDKLNSPNLLAQLRTATKGTVSDLELMKKAVNANNFQIPLNTLGKLLEFASRRARDTGQSVEFLSESIVTGIARKSPLILDNLGINIKRINDEFQKTGDFAKAAFNVVNQELEKAGPALETNADKVDRLAAKWQNFWTEVGAGAVTVGDNIANFFNKLIDPAAAAADEANQKIAESNQNAFDYELRVMQTYKDKLATADKAGRDKIIDQVNSDITVTKRLRDEAFAKGLTSQGDQFDRYLDLWNKFLLDIQGGNLGSNTIANLEGALSLLQQQLKTAEIGSDNFKKIKKEIAKTQQELDAATGKTAGEAAKKVSDANKKILEDYKRLREELRKLVNDRPDASPFEKEVQSLTEKFEQLRELAHGNRQKLKEIDEQYYIELLEIQIKFGRLELEEFIRKEKEKEKRTLDLQQRISDRTIGTGTNDRLDTATTDKAEKDARNKLAGLELEVRKKTGKQRLQAELELLEEQKRQELSNKDLTENEKLLIEDKYRELRKQKEIDHIVAITEQIAGFAQQALDVFTIFTDARTAKENAELDADRQRNDTKKRNFDRQLKGKVITQFQYDREIQKLEKEQEKREKEVRLKQFKRQQRADIIQAIINGAMAITSTLAAKPGATDIISLGAFRAIQIGLAVATTAAQIATIAKQKAPEHAKGGKLGGRSHSEGGNPILDGSGRKIAEIEKGEGIINKKTMSDRRNYTLSGTPSQIASTINRLHGGVGWDASARIVPEWRITKPPRMNFTAMKKAYASGGVFETPGQSQPAQNIDLTEMTNVIRDMQVTLATIQREGITAFTLLTQHEKQQARLNSIRSDSTMKG
jgi:hypothetical protein